MDNTRKPTHFYILDFANGFLSLSDIQKAKLLLYGVSLNALYLAALIFGIHFLPPELSQTLNKNTASNIIFMAIFYGFFAFIAGVTGELLEFSSKVIQDVYIYTAILMFCTGSLFVAHMLGDLTIITGVATSGAPIAGMVLFETRKLLHSFFFATLIYIIIVLLTFLGFARYAPLINDVTNYTSNPVWIGLVFLSAIPNIVVIMSIGIASILSWKKREQETIYLSQKDVLTGANNRRHLMDLLTQSIHNALLNKTPLCLMMVDIDHFKNINDTYGHLIGDKVIKHLSDLIASNLHGVAYFGRYGGEEFCLVTPYTQEEKALEQAEHLLHVINHTPFIFQPDNGSQEIQIHLTVSIGISSLRLDETYLHATDTLLFESDQAMYDIKRGGRNGAKMYAV